MTRALVPFGLLLLGLLLSGGGLAAAEPKAADLGKEALALLQARCVRCHGADRPKAKLSLADSESLRRGGRHGAVVAPGKPDDSPLWQFVRDGRMPPKEPLAENERALLRHWIESGAPAPAGAPAHWAFRLPVRPPVPAVNHGERVRTDVERFIEAALEQKGLTPGPEADRATLVRRVCFDLTGLPPTPAEVDAFVADPAPDAYEKLVDRLLASPRYGERWGKYWLDAAGYADSNGYFSADSDRPLAYRYRDYVIRAFNDDKPYDRFVREQLAGDELVGYVLGGDVTPAMVEPLVATHFLRNAPDGSGESDGNPDEVRTDRFSVLEGNLQVTMNCLLGVTIQCARCHSHKFEPISHEDYYRLEAILYPAYCPDRWVKPNDRVVEVGSRAEREEHRRRTERVDRQVKALQEGLQTMAGPLREQLLEERLRPLDAPARAALVQAATTPKAKRTPEQATLLQQHKEAEVSDDDLAGRFPEFAAVREQVRKAVAVREKERPPPLDRLAVLTEKDADPPAHHILLRGQHNAPGPEVQPGVPAALTLPGNEFRLDPRPAGQAGTGRRSAFARWVTAPENPLFARVMVNRVWQHHFGTGLVATPDNLGQSGARPSHPELLDWLATEFVRSGWSVKALHRLIVTSAVYCQSSAPREEALRVDPDNRLLASYPLRRLDAEAVRDGLLALSGELDERMGGSYVPTRRRPDGGVDVDEGRDGAHRRSVYLQQRRTQVATLLELFDAPAMASNCSARTTSTVPLQSLALLNSEFVRARARAFAVRLGREAGGDVDSRLSLAFRLAAGRGPDADERAAARRFLAAQQALYAGDKDADRRAWADLCQMVLASNAFLYVE
jgi:mono/diheme cytochrome c family protein